MTTHEIVELEILTPEIITSEIATPIFDEEIFTKNLCLALEKYDIKKYEEISLVELKTDAASLRRIKKIISDQRIEIKKKYLEPYEKLEEKIKRVIKIIDAPLEKILLHLEFREKEEDTKKEKLIHDGFNEIFRDYPRVKFQTVWNPRWLNKSYKLEIIEEELLNIRNNIAEGEKAIESGSPSEFQFAMYDTLYETLNLAKAFETERKLKEQKEILEKERARKKSAEEYLASIRETNKKIKETEEKRKEEIIEEEKQFKKEFEERFHTEKTITLRFEITETESKISQLKQFLIEKNIKVKRI
jgi:hypothetical protein